MAGLFLASSLVVLFVVYSVVRFVGLPDWVFWGAIGLLAVGLPIMLMAGKHERQRAEAALTGTHVPTPTGMQRHFTWRKALLGGGLAFAGLALVAGGYMAMRVFGIGPVGTLVASGVLDERGRLIVAEFADRTPDGNVAPSVTQALRIDLSQSRAVRLMDATAIREALERMQRPDTARVEGALAREIAQRESVKAIVDGDVGVLGSGYVVAARLVGASDGAELLALRETAADAAGLIPAVDRLSKKLRERIGESLKTLRASEPLDRVTTSSLDALRFYTRAEQAEQRGAVDESIRLLEQAIAEDTLFAMAYRKLGVVLGNAFRERSRIDAALTKAFELRDRLPPLERGHAAAYYYSNVEQDAERAIDAYRSVLAIDPDDGRALNNQAVLLGSRLRRWPEAEASYRRAIAGGAVYQNFTGLIIVLTRQGRSEAADSALAAFEAWSPGHPIAMEYSVWLATARRSYAAADSMMRFLPASRRAGPSFFQAGLPEVRGQLRASGQVAARMLAEAERAGDNLDRLRWALWLVRQELRYRDPAAAVRALERVLGQHPLDLVEPADRPHAEVAELYAATGRVAEVRRLRGEWEAAARRSPAERAAWDGLEATAERRFGDAIAAYRRANEQQGSLVAFLPELARAYDLADQRDSALAVYERAIAAPEPFKFVDADFDRLGPTYKRMGELYEARGDRQKALDSYGKFVDLWKDADAELQPLVTDVKARIARLVGERR
ncbi:MAG: hypothetical protein HY337_03515 [Gemmatimonadetes bacterium]|nr:hypothetical protein [Gemmatimonadota bacterium]